MKEDRGRQRRRASEAPELALTGGQCGDRLQQTNLPMMSSAPRLLQLHPNQAVGQVFSRISRWDLSISGTGGPDDDDPEDDLPKRRHQEGTSGHVSTSSRLPDPS